MRVRTEIRRLSGLALPVMAAQVGGMMLGTVDTLMVGRVGADALAAAAIANAFIFAVILIGQGIVQGIDPLVTQHHGAGRGDSVALSFQRGLVLAVLVGVPLGASLLVTEPFLLAVGQDPALAGLARRYALVQAPGIPAFLLFLTLRQYLVGREIVRPAMWVMIAANGVNAFANWVLIFGHLGVPALGLLGAGIATTISRYVTLLMLWGFTWGFGLQRGAWVPWSRAALDPRALWRIAAIGIPIAIQISLESWAFGTSTLLAGHLGAASAAAHAIVMNMASLSFMLPLGISHGASTRVGNLLGARDSAGAQLACWVAIALGAGVMTISAVGFFLLRWQLPSLYTAEPELIALGATILPIAAAFQLFDGAQVVGCGVLRGMGRTVPAAWANFVGYWLIGLPVAAYLALFSDWGLAGVWWGMCLGLGLVAGTLLLWLRARGPARAGLYVA